MMRIIKFIAAGCAVALLLVFIVAALVHFLVDPEDYRDFIVDSVEAQTGRQLQIDGELGLALLPCCSISIDGAELSHPDDSFQGDYFARVEQARIGLRLFSLLLQQRVVMSELQLIGMDLLLEERADGQVNWSFAASEDVSAEATEESSNTDAEIALDGLSIAGITLRDGQLSYRSVASNTDLVISDLKIVTDRITAGKPFAIDARLTAQDQVSQQSMQLQWTAESIIQLEPLSLQFNDFVMDASSSGVTLELTGAGTASADDYDLKGQLKIPEFSPQALLKDLGEPEWVTADPEVLQRFAVTAQWSLDTQQVLLQALKLTLDDSVITGQLQHRYADAALTAFNITVDQIDLDRYTAPEEDAEAAGDSDTGTSTTEEPLPLETLRELSLNGEVTLQKLSVSGVDLQDVKAKITARNGKLTAQPLTAQLYSGQYSGEMVFNARSSTPALSFAHALTEVQAGGLLKDFAEVDNLSGLMQTRITGSSRGNTTTALIDNLNAEVAFELKDGIYQGLDFWQDIRRAYAVLKRKSPPDNSTNPQTQLEALMLQGRLANNVFTANQFLAEIPFLQINGKGNINLANDEVRFQLNALMNEAPTFDDGKDLEELVGLTIPMEIKGTLEEPKLKVELKDLAKDAAVKQVKDKLFEKLFDDEATTDSAAPAEEEEPKDRLKRGLRDLLGN